ncbi:MAG: sugar ABC transporter substrate-binding protein, partial [Acetatifactor sp.]|nr:sugar ABC transporter substrate-binding protein [Acetatifactor sp.]
MHLKNRIIMVAAVALGVAAVLAGGTGQVRPLEDADKRTGIFGSSDKETIYFWYTDETMTSFIN